MKDADRRPEPGGTPLKQRIHAALERIPDLAALPAVVSEILNLVSQENPDIERISFLAESDPALTLRILKTVNSPIYGQPQRVDSVRQAVRLLGTQAFLFLLCGSAVRECFSAKGDPAKDIWRHSLTAAVAVQLIAERLRLVSPQRAYLVGLLHDVGKLFLLHAAPEVFETARRLAEERGADDAETERELFDVDHPTIGKRILESWGLPREVAAGVWLHHQPPEALGRIKDGGLAGLVRLSDILAHETVMDRGRRVFCVDETVERDLLRDRLGLSAQDLDAIRPEIGRLYAERAAFFDLDADEAGFYYDALSRASRMLSDQAAELAVKSARLDRLRAAATLSAEVGATLAAAPPRSGDGVEEAMRLIADRLRAGSLDLGYVVLRDDDGARWLAWDEAGRTPAAALEGDTPFAEAGLPAALEKRLAACRPRLDSDGAPSGSCLEGGFIVLPLGRPGADAFRSSPSNDEWRGEIGFALPEESFPVPPEELAAWEQFGQAVTAGLDRARLSRRLDERIEELACALADAKSANQRLMHAERLAAVGRLAAGAAHEINNPLAIISARAQLLLQQEQDEPRSKALTLMLEQMERISAILSSLMGLARPTPPRSERFSLTRLIERCLDLMRSGLRQRAIAVDKRLDPDLPMVVGDPGQLEQAFLNLFLNAQQAMEERGGSLGVSARSGANGQVVIVVEDQGVGIAPEDLPHIFDPFFTTKEEGRGMGLGLATVHSVVVGHRGTIRARSRPGEGAAFTIELPPAEPEPESVVRREKRVLIIDDERQIVDILREALRARGCAADAASDGLEGERLLSEAQYDLVLLDLRMPRQGGLQLLAKMRLDKPELPVIVMTGLAGPEEVLQAERLGARLLVKKPFQLDALIRDVESLLESRLH